MSDTDTRVQRAPLPEAAQSRRRTRRRDPRRTCLDWPGVAVKRIKPNILSERFDESRSFYTGVIGLEEAPGLDWILFFGTSSARCN